MKRKALFTALVLVMVLSMVYSVPALAWPPTTVLTVSVSATGHPGDPVVLTITETNDGDCSLLDAYIEVSYGATTDVYDWYDLTSGDDGNRVLNKGVDGNPGESWVWVITYYPTSTVTYTITGHAFYNGVDVTYPLDPDEQKIVTVTIEETGGEGLTPGFWKNHLGEWAETAYAPTDIFHSVFGVGPSITLRAAINAKGGGENALLRHAVAALLNASHPEVDYPMTTAEVIAAVNQAYSTGNFEGIKDTFEGYNELGDS